MLWDDLRAAWNPIPTNGTVSTVVPSQRTEFVVHWPGSTFAKPGPADHQRCLNFVLAMQRFHISTRGWADIGYNGFVCVHGRKIEGRGIDTQGAHATGHNIVGYGLNFIVGLDWSPTPLMFNVMREVRAWCEGHSSKDLKPYGHGQLSGSVTDCPGDVIRAWVTAGMPYQEGDSMDQAQYDALLAGVKGAQAAAEGARAAVATQGAKIETLATSFTNLNTTVAKLSENATLDRLNLDQRLYSIGTSVTKLAEEQAVEFAGIAERVASQQSVNDLGAKLDQPREAKLVLPIQVV